MNNAIADLKKNTLYVAEELKAYQVEIKTPEGRFLTLDDFLTKARAHLNKGPEKVTEQKVPSSLIAMMIALNSASGSAVDIHQLQTMIHGFMLGELFERLRTRRELTCTTTEFDLSALEMDKVISGEKDDNG